MNEDDSISLSLMNFLSESLIRTKMNTWKILEEIPVFSCITDEMHCGKIEQIKSFSSGISALMIFDIDAW